MSKMDAAQKAKNKEAAKHRDQAYRARHAEYESAKMVSFERLRNAPEYAETTQAVEQLRREFDSMLQRRNEAQLAISTQISKLQNDLIALDAEYSGPLDALRDRHKISWSKKTALEAAMEKELKVKFADIDGCYNAASWRPFTDFYTD